MKKLQTALVLSGALAFGVLRAGPADAVDTAKVLSTYADIAHAMYEDSLISARTLRQAVDDLVAKPSRAALLRARAAWIAARVPYQQSEVYRFGTTT